MKIVAVSGYFDPIHIGHIEYFKLAKSLGDKLIVILNNDKQAELKKGKAFMPAEERKIILEALEHVDEVFMSIDEDATVVESLKKLHELYTLSVFAKGGDRFIEEVPETKICRELGIEMVDSLGNKIQSSSSLIKKSYGSEFTKTNKVRNENN